MTVTSLGPPFRSRLRSSASFNLTRNSAFLVGFKEAEKHNSAPLERSTTKSTNNGRQNTSVKSSYTISTIGTVPTHSLSSPSGDVRWDRGGVIISELIDYNSEPEFMQVFCVSPLLVLKFEVGTSLGSSLPKTSALETCPELRTSDSLLVIKVHRSGPASHAPSICCDSPQRISFLRSPPHMARARDSHFRRTFCPTEETC